MRQRAPKSAAASFALTCAAGLWLCFCGRAEAAEPVRVFIFAGQSNMVGSDSKVGDVDRFPPFRGLEEPQPRVRFSHCIGREEKTRSNGWVDLQPVNGVVGPELSFAREVTRSIDVPIAIVKCAAGGTHLGGDWNPDDPSGFEMYPLALDHVRSSLAELDRRKIPYRLEGFVWHQGENDMFNEEFLANYGRNLATFLAAWRRDLQAPNLRFYVGELCTKTIWGMDLRPRMYAISLGQRSVTEKDRFADYVPTSHIGVEIGGGVGLHYHYGTLGQLEHGVNYAEAYLRSIGVDGGENEMSMPPYRSNAARWLASTIAGSRRDLDHAGLRWYVGQQPPTDHEQVNAIDVTAQLARLAAVDDEVVHVKAFDLPEQEEQLVLDAPAIVRLGERLAASWLQDRRE